MSFGTVKLKSSAQPQSCRSSSWKWMAAYMCGARFQSRSPSLHAAPFMARVGRFTSLPCRPLGPVSSISIVAMRRAKSQAPRPAIAGASILPLKQRRAGRSAALSAPIEHRLRRVDRKALSRRARLALVVDGERALQGLLAHPHHAGRGIGPGPDAIPGAIAQLLADDDARAAAFQRHAVGRQHQREARALACSWAASRREITVCGPSSGRVGQISASTARAPGSFTSAARSISA